MPRREYRIVIEAASDEDGGGYLAFVPELPGCMSDGATYEEAAHNVADAIESWIEAAEELGRDVPEPTRQRALA